MTARTLETGWLGLVLLLIATPTVANAADITVNGVGSTFIIHFDEGYTPERADTIEAAAQHWADLISSPVPIEVDLSFVDWMFCNETSATLGSAGTTTVIRDFQNAPVSNTWYPQALANSLAGSDLDSANSDIHASFNAKLDDPAYEDDCLGGTDWHYGLDPTPPGDINFHEVVLHELAHGLGFQNFADLGDTGELFLDRDDHFVRLLKDQSSGRTLSKADMSDAERAAAAIDTGDLVWSGSNTSFAADGFLTGGMNGSQVRMYAPDPYRSGSSASHFDTVLAPNEVMEPFATGTGQTVLTEALFNDLGWAVVGEPEITGQGALSIPEDTSIAVDLADLLVSDPDSTYPDDFQLFLGDGDDHDVAGTTVTPDTDFHGELLVDAWVNDGSIDSNVFPLSITVTPVNDQPVIADQVPLETDEDAALEITTADLTIVDPDDSTHTLTLATGANYTFTGTTVVPDPNFHGTLWVSVRADDGELESDPFVVEITVHSTNDPPQVTSSSPLETLEDTSLEIELMAVTFTDTDPEDAGNHSLRIVSGQNYSVTSNTTFLPASNFHGLLGVRVVVNDGEDDSEPHEVQVDVLPVNDPPQVVGSVPLEVTEDSSIGLDIEDLVILDPDPEQAFPEDFSFTVLAGADYSVVGTTIHPAPNFHGTLPIGVRVYDPEAASGTGTIDILVSSVDDPPSIASASAVEVDATGLWTPLPNLTPPSVTDDNPEPLVASPQEELPTHLRPGTHTITWSVTDIAGHDAETDQVVTVRPLVSLSGDQTIEAGSTARFQVWLNGSSPTYPLDIDYRVSGTASGHDLVDGTVTFEDGDRMQEVVFTIPPGSVGDAPETIVVRLDGDHPFGPQRTTTLIVVAEGSLEDHPDDTGPAYSDSDGDGIADEFDPYVIPFALPFGSELEDILAVETEPGVQLRLGMIAFEHDADGTQVSEPEIISSGFAAATALDSYLDVVITRLSEPGRMSRLVLAQPTSLPEQAAVHLLHPNTSSFAVDARNAIASAEGHDGACPPPGSPDYQSGLQPGHWCVELRIEDGGPNDMDGSANGTIVWLGQVADAEVSTPPNLGDLTHSAAKARSGACNGSSSSPNLPVWLAVVLGLRLRCLRRRRQPWRS